MNQNPVVVSLNSVSADTLDEIGGYRRCFQIGAGGMATVLLTREVCDDGLQRMVALKVLHHYLSKQPGLRARFLDEARSLSQISHPNVCRVFDFGEDRGRPYVAMEYLVGEKLSGLFVALQKRDDVPPLARARYFAQVVADLADGLHAAHEACAEDGTPLGIVHRDVVPENLFLLYDGTARVAEFGVARYGDRHVLTATTGRLLHKLWYMAPEQVLSEPTDRRVDVWGLGVTLWELVTLRRLFKRPNQIATMRAICSEPIPRLASLVRGVPEGLDAILSRALEKNPILRYQSAQALSEDLREWLEENGGPVTRSELAQFLQGFFPQFGRDDLSMRSSRPSRVDSVRAPDSSTKVALRAPRVPSGTALPHRAANDVESFPPLAPRRSRAALATSAEADISGARPTVPSREPPSQRSGKHPSLWERPEEGTLGRGLVPLELRASDFWAPLRDTVWRVAVPVAPVLFTLGLLVAAHLDLSRQPKAAGTTMDLVASRLTALQAALVPAPPEVGPGTGELLLVSEVPNTRVFRDGALLGTTPVRLRLPEGPVALEAQLGTTGPRTPLSLEVARSELQVVSVTPP